MALTQHKREVLSVAYDSLSSKYCVTTGKDKSMIVYQLDNYYHQAKMILNQTVPFIEEHGLTALCVVDKFASQKPTAYVALVESQTLEVYAGVIDHEIKEMRQVLRVVDAQQDEINGVQLFFNSDKEEIYCVTSAKLDHRLNIWKVP